MSSLVETVLDPAGVFTGDPSLQGALDPGGTIIESATGSTLAQDIADPLDLFGGRAGRTAEEINELLKLSTQEGIALNEAQLAEIEKLTEPFRAAATGTALPTLSSLALGGNVDFQPSRLFGSQLEQGRENILRGQAAGPGIKSSATFGKLSDLVSGLAAEDVGRFERGQAGLLEAGRGAEQGLLQAGTRLSGNIGDLLSNLGRGQAATAQNLAQQQIASGQTAGSGLQGLAQLLATR